MTECLRQALGNQSGSDASNRNAIEAPKGTEEIEANLREARAGAGEAMPIRKRVKTGMDQNWNGSELEGIHDGHFRVPSKIRAVEGENFADSMDKHCGYQPRVMDVFAEDAVFGYQVKPLGVNWKLRQHFARLPKIVKFSKNPFRRQSQSVRFDWARGHRSEFDDILREGNQIPLIFEEGFDGAKSRCGMRMILLRKTQKNVCIDQNRH